MNKVTVVILSAGTSSRMNGINKLTYTLNPITNFTVLEASVYPFVVNSNIDNIILVTSPITYDEAIRLQEKYDKITVTNGGDTRAESVKNALKIINSDIVLLHDGARPYITNELINRVILSTLECGCAIPYIDSTDSLYDYIKGEYVTRDNIKRIQTPQGFNLHQLKQAISKADFDFKDEGVIYNRYIQPINLIYGDNDNIKITTRADLDSDYYVGVGYDVHQLVANRPLILGGIEIDYPLGLLGHSNADVLTHAIMDSLLGAGGLRDIGYYFPDTDNEYLGIDSLILLKKVVDMVREKGFEIVNINAEILAQKPKLKDIIPLMRTKLATTLSVPEDKISLSATTTENLGIIGENKGMASYSVCSLKKINK